MTALSGRNIITVPVCTKCGRGFFNEFAKNAAIDSQPVWWTLEAEGPRCDGPIMHVDRMKQIERVYGEEGKILSPGEVYAI